MAVTVATNGRPSETRATCVKRGGMVETPRHQQSESESESESGVAMHAAVVVRNDETKKDDTTNPNAKKVKAVPAQLARS